jgi:hypothetical protein
MSCLLYTGFYQEEHTMNDVSKLYTRRMIMAAVAYTVLILATRVLLRGDLAESPISPIIALLPILPVFFGVFALMSFVRSVDELQQKIQLEAMAFSLGVTGLITFALGLVEGTGLPFISMTWVLPMIVALWGIGLAIATRRYQ